jgi:hypothetical protein
MVNKFEQKIDEHIDKHVIQSGTFILFNKDSVTINEIKEGYLGLVISVYEGLPFIMKIINVKELKDKAFMFTNDVLKNKEDIKLLGRWSSYADIHN